MKLYEGLFLFDANLAAKDWPGLEKHVGDLLTKNEAEMVYSERWPDRKLAYEVKGCRKGTYFLTYFNAPGPAITALHRDVQLSERVLRLMVLQNEYIEEVLETHKTRQAEREAAREEKAAAAAAASDEKPETVSEESSEAAPEAEATETEVPTLRALYACASLLDQTISEEGVAIKRVRQDVDLTVVQSAVAAKA